MEMIYLDISVRTFELAFFVNKQKQILNHLSICVTQMVSFKLLLNQNFAVEKPQQNFGLILLSKVIFIQPR